MKNVILIDFSITSKEALKSICDEVKINFDVLSYDAKNLKFYKVWVELSTKTMIAYTTQKRPNEMVFTDGFQNNLLNTNPYQLTSVLIDNLSLDDVLDKISKFGINSLLKEEKEFLDQYSRQ